MLLEAKILTVSDSVHAGTRHDLTGPAVSAAIESHGFHVTERRVVPDGIVAVSAALTEMTSSFHGLVVTAGGTGFAPTDRTPEATREVLEREAPGLAEAARSVSPLGRLSRGVAGTVGSALVINLPGSVAGAIESLDAVVEVLPHALELLGGGQPH